MPSTCVTGLSRVKPLKTRGEYIHVRSDFSSLKNGVLSPSTQDYFTIEA